jgi:hypothetical protein
MPWSSYNNEASKWILMIFFECKSRLLERSCKVGHTLGMKFVNNEVKVTLNQTAIIDYKRIILNPLKMLHIEHMVNSHVDKQ